MLLISFSNLIVILFSWIAFRLPLHQKLGQIMLLLTATVAVVLWSGSGSPVTGKAVIRQVTCFRVAPDLSADLNLPSDYDIFLKGFHITILQGVWLAALISAISSLLGVRHQ